MTWCSWQRFQEVAPYAAMPVGERIRELFYIFVSLLGARVLEQLSVLSLHSSVAINADPKLEFMLVNHSCTLSYLFLVFPILKHFPFYTRNKLVSADVTCTCVSCICVWMCNDVPQSLSNFSRAQVCSSKVLWGQRPGLNSLFWHLLFLSTLCITFSPSSSLLWALPPPQVSSLATFIKFSMPSFKYQVYIEKYKTKVKCKRRKWCGNRVSVRKKKR